MLTQENNQLNQMFQNRKRYELLRRAAIDINKAVNIFKKFQNRKRYELLRRLTDTLEALSALACFKFQNRKRYELLRRKLTKSILMVNSLQFQNRKRYELLRRSGQIKIRR